MKDENVIHNSISDSLRTLEDLFNTSLSTGKISGGDITDNGDGTVKVSAGHGYIRPVDDDNGEILFCDWSEESSLSLTNNSTNYIYVDYNNGEPIVKATTSFPSDHNTKILLGIVYREDNELHITTAGQAVTNYNLKTFFKDVDINGEFQRVNGLLLSEKPDRKFAISEGTIYVGLTKTTFNAFDTSSGDTFTYYYRDGSGGWTKVTGQTQIDNLHYDDGSGTLAELSNPSGWRKYYGVHWVYVDNDGHVFVLYGQGDYLLTEAENATPPSELPPILQGIGSKLVGKIIIEKNASSFQAIYSAFETEFTPSVVTDHNLLSGLQGGASDEYYHLTESQHTEANSFLDGGNKTHTDIDNHIEDMSIHFTKNSINLQDLNNVNSSISPTDGQVLVWNATNNYWTAGTVSGGGSSDDINVEDLTGNKTLVAGTDAKYQWLNPNGASRTITLDTSSAAKGDRFIIKNNANYSYSYYLDVYSGSTLVDRIRSQSIKEFIFDGSDWIPASTETLEKNIAIGNSANAYSYGVAIGEDSNASYRGVAIGRNANGNYYGVAIGYYSFGSTSGVSIGYNASGYNYGVAIGKGADTDTNPYSIALGYYSKCSSYGQTAINIDDSTSPHSQYVQYRLTVQTTDSTQTEMWAAGSSGQRINIRPQSHFAFKGIIVARNDADNEGMSWEVKGMIKRDASGNTSLVGTPTITEIAKDGTLSWSVSIEADDTNDALVIKVTGEDGKTIRWAAVLDGVEVTV